MNNYINKESNRGFTIIELLIVIVIIGILVAITAVSYNSLTKNTKEATLQSDLKQAKTSLGLNKAKTGTYPPNLESNIPPINQPNNSTFTYTQLDGGNSYSLVATNNTNSDIAFKTTPSTGITAIVPFVAGGHIQTATKDNCPSTRTLAVDARDNRTYYIQKLGNDCWMLTNLAYAGGGTNTYGDVINQGTGAPGTPKGTLSNGTSDTDATYTEAKYYIPTGANPTIDPTPPSTDTTGGGSGAGRQYGYLYNGCAAMGGQNTAACANATTPAPIPTINICPAGWRLPVGNGGEIAALNTAINGGSTSSDTGLLTSGLFQRSGFWSGGFSNQGSNGNYWYWSSPQHSAAYARYLYFSSTYVNTAGYHSYKSYGYAVRCVAE